VAAKKKTKKKASVMASTKKARAASEEEEEEKPKRRMDEETLSKRIKILVDENPKRAGSKSAARFDLYEDGMTVGEALDAGVWPADIRYDSEVKGFIKLI